MAFPVDPTDLDIEMNLAGTWTNLRTSGFVLDRGITITRGRSDEAGQVAPSALSMTLNNTDGRFSPRNPTGPYYGVLGRNTPIRASVSRGPYSLETRGSAGDEVTTPDAPALGFTGDIDVRIDITTDAWDSRNLCGKFEATGNQRSWLFQTGPDGSLRFAWTTDGTIAGAAAGISSVGIPMSPRRLALRATVDVDNGAGSNVVTFYTAPTIAGPWVQLGAPVVGALGTTGVTTIFDGTAPIEIGSVPDEPLVIAMSSWEIGSAARPVVGRINAFELRNGISGTVVANPNFTAQASGITSFADTAATPNTWTLQGNTAINNRHWRFYGELANIPPQWDVSGKDVYATVEANGILRRLGQASSPLHSPIRRSLDVLPGKVAYWPCEDASAATSIASAVQGQRPMTFTGSPSLGSSDVFAGSESLPVVAKSKWTGAVPAYTPTGQSQVMFLVQIPAGLPTNTVIARVFTSGGLDHINIIYTTDVGGSITWAAFDPNGSTIWAAGSTFNTLNGDLLRISVELTQNGANVDAVCGVDTVGLPSGGGLLQTATGQTFGRITSVVISPNSDVDQVTVGHISVGSTIIDRSTLDNQSTGFFGESAGRRVERLCGEIGVAFRGIGNLDDSEPMGVQKTGAFTDLIQQCAEADMGMLFEPRDMLGIGYRTRTSFYNQPARVALDYDADQISGSLAPTDDDQQIRNDVTVSRDNGSSFRTQQIDGRMSVNPPPNGVGLYDDSVSVNVKTDDQLPNQAGWRVHVGTVDEARYPVIGVDFTTSGIVGNSALNDALLSLEVGDRLTVANPPPWLPPDDISQLVQGTSESYGNFTHSMSLNCAPASPYLVAVLDDNTGRLDTDGSQLATAESATDTLWSVATTAGPIWTTDEADWPFDVMVGGEQVTVTAVGQVLNSNPSFEAGIAGWTAFGGATIAPSTAQAQTGKGSMLLTTSGVASPRAEAAKVPVTAGQLYRAVGWIYAASAFTTAIGISVNWYDATNTFLSTSSNPILPGTGLWESRDTIFTAPAGATQAGIVLSCSGTPAAGLQLYGDEIRLIPVTSYVSSPQTFTVTRSVNGVVKAQSAGQDVRLAHPTFISL